MALLQAWKSRVAAHKRKESMLRARGLAGTPAAVMPGADFDEFSAPEGPFGRLDISQTELPPQPITERKAEVQSVPA